MVGNACCNNCWLHTLLSVEYGFVNLHPGMPEVKYVLIQFDLEVTFILTNISTCMYLYK